MENIYIRRYKVAKNMGNKDLLNQIAKKILINDLSIYLSNYLCVQFKLKIY